MKKRNNIINSLNNKIEISGLKKNYIAKSLDISNNYLSMLLHGKRKGNKTIENLTRFIESAISSQTKLQKWNESIRRISFK